MLTWLHIDQKEVLHSIRTAVAAVGSLLIARFFRLPESHWAAITTIVIGRNAFRYAGITLAIVMLIARAEPAWMVAIYRFLEIFMGIAVALLVTAVWPAPEPAAAA